MTSWGRSAPGLGERIHVESIMEGPGFSRLISRVLLGLGMRTRMRQGVDDQGSFPSGASGGGEDGGAREECRSDTNVSAGGRAGNQRQGGNRMSNNNQK